jgi:hypothetical protein
MGLRTSIPASLSAFTSWLAVNPVAGDSIFSGSSVRYQVARYCDYLGTNPWLSADPLGDEVARDGAVSAYRDYLDTFNVPRATIDAVLVSLDRFYVFLGLGPVRLEAVSRRDPVATQRT